MDWFFGFKLHLVFNDQGEVMWLQLTPGNVDDRKGLLSMVENPFPSIFGKLFGDLGYLSKALFEQLVLNHGLNISQIEHSRHRSPVNFVVNLICGLIAYAHQSKKPSLGLMTNELA